MRTSASPLLVIFRSQLQGEILAEIYLRADDRPMSITDLSQVLEAPVATVHREVSRLIEAGLISEIRSGRSRLLSAPDDQDLVTRPLRDLLAVTFGPVPVLSGLFSGLDDVPAAMIYGSWAARYEGVPGPVPVDVDVLVINDVVDLDDLDDLSREAVRLLRRDVSIRRVSPARWATPGGDPFLESVQSRPLVAITDPARDLVAALA